MAQRFGDAAGWKFQGYTILFLFPQIGDWGWEQIVDLRRDPNMARFRAVLGQIEAKAAAEAVQVTWRRRCIMLMNGTAPLLSPSGPASAGRSALS